MALFFTIICLVFEMIVCQVTITLLLSGKLIPFLENLASEASILTILAISFERYYAICHPLKAHLTCTFVRMLKVVSSIWLIASLSSSPFFNIAIHKDSRLVDGTPIKVCRIYIRQTWHKVYLMWSTGFFILIPLIVLVVLYIVIARKLIRDTQLVNSKNDCISHANLKARKQVVYMLFAVVLVFFLCMLPIKVVGMWMIFITKVDLVKLGLEGYLNLIYFCRVMMYMNSVLNPVMYSMLSTKFRDAFRRVLGVPRAFWRGKIGRMSSNGTLCPSGSARSSSSMNSRNSRSFRYKSCTNCSHDNRPSFLKIKFSNSSRMSTKTLTSPQEQYEQRETSPFTATPIDQSYSVNNNCNDVSNV